MSILIDTNIAIHWRDGDAEVIRRTQSFMTLPAISILTQIELSNGIYARKDTQIRRLVGAERLYRHLPVLDLDAAVARAYDAILAATGFSRSRVFDRMIAATAIAHDLTLITINGDDFRDIPGLDLEIWPHPAAQ